MHDNTLASFGSNYDLSQTNLNMPSEPTKFDCINIAKCKKQKLIKVLINLR
jgi:hypothetical protein